MAHLGVSSFQDSRRAARRHCREQCSWKQPHIYTQHREERCVQWPSLREWCRGCIWGPPAKTPYRDEPLSPRSTAEGGCPAPATSSPS